MQGASPSPYVHQPFPWGTSAMSSAEVSGRWKRAACCDITHWVFHFYVRYVEGSVGTAQAFCFTVRWEIKTYSKVTSDFASNANESTAGIKLIKILGSDN